MALFFPLLDTGLGLLLLLGSPGIGYVILRCVVYTSKYWEGWKRLLAGSIIGGGWTFSIFWIFSPLLQTNAPVSVIVEYFAYAGAGLFGLTALTALANRLIISRVLASYFPTSSFPPVSLGSTPPESPPVEKNAWSNMYKASQLRSHATNTPSPFVEPTLENDVLSLLKQENADATPPKTKKIPKQKGDSEDLVADEWNEEESAANTSSQKRSPMDDLGEFAGFEETMAQLKRDLKDFNESVARPAKHRNKNA